VEVPPDTCRAHHQERIQLVCAPDDGWKYHPKHVEQFPDINKLCNVVSYWIYIGILSGAQYILHISRIKVNSVNANFAQECKVKDKLW